MSMDLYLWKSPLTDDPDEAAKLLDRYFKSGEQGVFEPNPDIAAVADELRQLYPYWPVPGEELVASMSDEDRSKYTEEGLAQLREFGSVAQAEDGPWADLPFEQSDNLLALSIRWSAGDKVLDDIVRLGREHELVVYDPQGPDVHLPDDPLVPKEAPPPSAADCAKTVLIVVLFIAATYGAWLIPWGWLRWPLAAIGLFFTAAALLAFYAVIAAALEGKPRP